MDFNTRLPGVVHIDLNSCFATIEQQANPLLRGKAIAVAAYTTPRGCILAPSVEAKKMGVKTGMRVRDGQKLCPGLIILPSDPQKYRNVHLSLRRLLSDYTAEVTPKSIDEFVLDLTDSLALKRLGSVKDVAVEIKRRIKSEIGEWLTVSVGISTNRFLAKLASSLHKPDGLDEINRVNFMQVFSGLDLTDLPYIKTRNAIRLNGTGIFTVLDFYRAPLWKLRAAFQSVLGYYWHCRLRGYEVDSTEFSRKSVGNSYALPKPLINDQNMAPILAKLVEKTGFRLRSLGFKARGIHLGILFRSGRFWHKGTVVEKYLSDSRDIYRRIYGLMMNCPYKEAVSQIAVSVFDLSKGKEIQLEIFDDVSKKDALLRATDRVNRRWGNFVVTPARMLSATRLVPDRIAFGSVREIEDQVFGSGIKD